MGPLLGETLYPTVSQNTFKLDPQSIFPSTLTRKVISKEGCVPGLCGVLLNSNPGREKKSH